MDKYKPEKIAVRTQGEELVIIDLENDFYENAILLTVGHKDTDLSKSMLNQFVADFVSSYNQKNI